MSFPPLTATACSLVSPALAVVVVPNSSASVLKVILKGRTWAETKTQLVAKVYGNLVVETHCILRLR